MGILTKLTGVLLIVPELLVKIFETGIHFLTLFTIQYGCFVFPEKQDNFTNFNPTYLNNTICFINTV